MEDYFLMPKKTGKELEIVKKDNRLIEAKYRLSIHEQRLMWAVLGSIQVDDEDFKKYTINIREIAEFHGLKANKDLYTQIQESARTLKNSEVDISRDGLNRYVNWLNYVEYRPGSGSVTICFNAELKPYLLNLKKNFTQYQLAAVANFKNSYSIRFYEFLKMEQYKGGGEQFYIKYSIEDLKDMLGIPQDEYKNTGDLKIRIITPALKEIDLQTDLKIVEVQYLKRGRAISEIKIYAEPKKQRALALQEQPDQPPEPPKEKALPKAVQELNAMGISTEEAKALLRKHKTDRIMQAIGYTKAMMSKQKIESPASYLRTVLKGDAGEGWAKEQAEKEQKKQLQLLKEKHDKIREAEKEQEKSEINTRILNDFFALSKPKRNKLIQEFLNDTADMFGKKARSEIKAKGENVIREMKSVEAHFLRFLKMKNTVS